MNAYLSLPRPVVPLLAIAIAACAGGQPTARSTSLHPLSAAEGAVAGGGGGVEGRTGRAGRTEAAPAVVTSRIEDLFTGRHAGLDVYRDGNSRIVMRLRGAEPLLLIDGLEADPDILGSLPPREVRSVEVLRSAAETAIYGSRGVDGVVRVTTHR